MNDLPPPYTPASDPVPATLPPSYDDATAHTSPPRRASNTSNTSHASNARIAHPRLLQYQPTASQPPTEKKKQEALRGVLRRFPWTKSMGRLPTTADDALYTACLWASEGLVRALVDELQTPVAFTDRFAAVKQARGCAVHAAVLGAAPHLAEFLVQAHWGRVYASFVTHHGPDAATVAADDQVRRLLDARDAHGCTPMHRAAQAGAADAVRAMVRRGAELDPVDDLGRTPLHTAARYGRRDVADLLVSIGARTSHLLSHDADADDSPWHRVTPAHAADLGTPAFIARFVGDAVARNSKRDGASVSRDVVGTDVADVAARDAAATDAKPATSSGSASSSVAGTGASANDKDALPALSFVHGYGRAGPDGIALPDPFDLRAGAPTPLVERVQGRKGKAPANPWRRVATGAPEYLPELDAWKTGLDRLQREHQAQRARNVRSEIPDEYALFGE